MLRSVERGASIKDKYGNKQAGASFYSSTRLFVVSPIIYKNLLVTLYSYFVMDYEQTLKLLAQGSSSQRKRKIWLDKEKKSLLQKMVKQSKPDQKTSQELQTCIDNQLRLCAKIRQGIQNSRRTLLIRQFFAKVFQRKLVSDFQEVVALVDMFDEWLDSYEKVIQEKDLKKEEMENARILMLCKKFETRKKTILAAAQKSADVKERASLLFLALLLTTIILLFSETKEIAFDVSVFSSGNRYNPLNAFFPLKS